MKTKSLFFILILSLSVNMAVISMVGYHYYRNFCISPAIPCPINQEGRHLYQSLGLSDAQLAKMAPLSKEFHARLAALESQVITKRDLLVGLLKKEETDQSLIEKVRKEISAIQDEIQREVVIHITRTKEILNPEQRRHFFELLQDSASSSQLNPAFPITGGNK
jgi:Spy/CpxP family protein refolding chaperone